MKVDTRSPSVPVKRKRERNETDRNGWLCHMFSHALLGTWPKNQTIINHTEGGSQKA